jgi:hypothetical protein
MRPGPGVRGGNVFKNEASRWHHKGTARCPRRGGTHELDSLKSGRQTCEGHSQRSSRHQRRRCLNRRYVAIALSQRTVAKDNTQFVVCNARLGDKLTQSTIQVFPSLRFVSYHKCRSSWLRCIVRVGTSSWCIWIGPELALIEHP